MDILIYLGVLPIECWQSISHPYGLQLHCDMVSQTL